MCMYISMWVCACMCVCLQRPEEGIRLSVARVTGGCELPEMGLGTELWSSGIGAASILSLSS